MNESIRSWFVDLYNRLDRMIMYLDNRAMDTRLSSEYKSRAIVEMTNLKIRISKLIQSKILNKDFFTPNLIVKYNLFNEEFLEAEKFLFLPIKNYDDKAEGFFELLIQSIYEEADLLLFVPFVSCVSNSETYFWVYSKYNMIAVPQGEENHLLNLCDIYHEIGHLFFSLHKGLFMRDLEVLVGTYYDTIIKKSGKGLKRVRIKATLERAYKFWTRSWLEEIACDMIAVYLVGPAYAWSNLKICSVSSWLNKMYSTDDEHPGDEVRMRGIIKTLELIGCHEDIPEIKEAWQKLLSVISNDKQKYYKDIYCEDLINCIAEKVFGFCRDHGLRSYPQQKIASTRPISEVINDALNKIRKDHENFAAWESNEIESLHSRMQYFRTLSE